eukprot:125934-Karenia_brevis.AAC.1
MLLEKVARIFARLALDLNWKRGKSECIVRYRGHGATAVYQSHIADGCIVYEVPSIPGLTSGNVLHAVDRYAHLGCVISASGGLHDDAKKKETAALSAYAPIAVRVFGCTKLQEELKRSMAVSLVEFRL